MLGGRDQNNSALRGHRADDSAASAVGAVEMVDLGPAMGWREQLMEADARENRRGIRGTVRARRFEQNVATPGWSPCQCQCQCQCEPRGKRRLFALRCEKMTIRPKCPQSTEASPTNGNSSKLKE